MIIGCNAQDKVKVPKNPEQTVKIKKSDSVHFINLPKQKL